MKRTRNWHLWIGIFSSLFLFMEAGTGLLLTERWLLGSSAHAHNAAHSGEHLSMTDAVKKASSSGAFQLEDVSVVMNHGMYVAVLKDAARTTVTIAPDGTVVSKEGNTFAAFVRGLHVGQVGGVSLRWVLDAAAISILVLTGTGMYMSWRILRTQYHKKKRLSSAA